MSLILTQSKTALGPNLTASFLAVGTDPGFTYSVLPNGAGGTINPTTGLYTAPATINYDEPKKLFDTIQTEDSLGVFATTQIMVGDPLLLFCEIIQQEMALAAGRVWLWDQKIFQPTDNGLYIPISVISCKPFANTISKDTSGWDNAVQSVNMMATLGIDIISRGHAARTRKEEVLLALNSIYSQSQQEANGFYIGKLPAGQKFLNLNFVDGAAIPYRFNIAVNIQYAFVKTKAVPYFDTFEDVAVLTNP